MINQDQVDEMPAGTHLDTRIVEEVMGWRVCWETSGPEEFTVYGAPEGDMPGSKYKFSTSNVAWLVVDYVCKVLGCFYEVGSDAGGHYAVFIPCGKEGAADVWAQASADTRPLAICRAARKAMRLVKRLKAYDGE